MSARHKTGRKTIAERIPRPKKKVTWPQARAFSVHLLTASGSFLAFLSLVAASEERWTAMFWWLGLALMVDGIDGPIARKLDVKEVLPTWSGELLDNIIDYVTYVLIPAFALYQRSRIARTARIVLSSREMGRIYHAKGVERLVRNDLWRGRSPERFYDALEWLYGWKVDNCLAAQ